MDIWCPRTLLTLIALMVAVQLSTFLLSKVVRRSRLSARIASLSKRFSPLLFGRRSLAIPPNGALVFDTKLQDRSGLETPMGGIDFGALISDLDSITSNLAQATVTPPQVLPYAPMFYSAVDNHGVVRTESLSHNETVPDPVARTLAKVIDLQSRLPGVK